MQGRTRRRRAVTRAAVVVAAMALTTIGGSRAVRSAAARTVHAAAAGEVDDRHQATPYCGSPLSPPNPDFVLQGRCESTLPVGFLSLDENEQHDLLEGVAYARKSPPRKRRCLTPRQGCSPSIAPGLPSAYVWARIQAVVGGRLIHPAALPADGAPVVLARVTYVRRQGSADRDSLTGARAVEDDYYLIARRNTTNPARGRVLFLRYVQRNDGTWSRDAQNVVDGYLEKCSEVHPHISPDMADFFRCENVGKALPPGFRDGTEYEVWRAFSTFLESQEQARRDASSGEKDSESPGIFRQAVFAREGESGSVQSRFSPYDDGGWMTCALGCCSTSRFF